MNEQEKIIGVLRDALKDGTFQKLILSRPNQKEILRCEVRRTEAGGGEKILCETFYADGKARHLPLTPSEAPERLAEMLLHDYHQLNLITTGGPFEAKISKGGKIWVSALPKGGERISAQPHNKEKRYLIPENVPCPFLHKLGICDENGRVYDKKQAKFRQINRFLEYVSDIVRYLPDEGTLRVMDLCCGKSYLSFAVYAYLTQTLGRTVSMIGADRKPDVIAYCQEIADSLGFDGLSFVCCDITTLQPSEPPHLVLSLHACDIATDIVLKTAVTRSASVILSTPCCHHELFSRYDPKRPGFAALCGLAEPTMIRGKMCEAITDSLRCRYLESEGYEVVTAELTDPENTPKNLLIRAVRSRKETDLTEKKAAYAALRDSFYGDQGGIR